MDADLVEVEHGVGGNKNAHKGGRFLGVLFNLGSIMPEIVLNGKKLVLDALRFEQCIDALGIITD